MYVFRCLLFLNGGQGRRQKEKKMQLVEKQQQLSFIQETQSNDEPPPGPSRTHQLHVLLFNLWNPLNSFVPNSQPNVGLARRANNETGVVCLAFSKFYFHRSRLYWRHPITRTPPFVPKCPRKAKVFVTRHAWKS